MTQDILKSALTKNPPKRLNGYDMRCKTKLHTTFEAEKKNM